MEEEVVKQPSENKLVILDMPDHMVHIELEDHICALFFREGVPCLYVGYIR